MATQFNLFVLFCFTFLIKTFSRPAWTTIKTPMVAEMDLFDPDMTLPEMEIPNMKPVDNVLSKHGFTYLMKFGYLPKSLLETGELRSAQDAKNAIRTFQHFANLTITGELDQNTIWMMDKRRCGMSDMETKDRVTQYSRKRKRRYTIVNRGWRKLDLSYHIINYTPDMQFENIRTAIHLAFKLWSDNSALRFKEVINGEADIRISFAKQYHSDAYPFDGKGLVLAHAFYPGSGRGGDIHFDDDETWTQKVRTEDVNLFSVAAHEFGHSLGLGHSSDPNSLMYPWYQDYYVNFTLPQDDADGISKLYGKNRPDRPGVTQKPFTPPPLPTKSSEIPDDGPDTCSTDYDAIAKVNNELFLFRDKWFWPVSENGRLQDKPVETTTFWYGMDGVVDAVYQSPKYGHIVFFRGTKYWVFVSNYIQKDFPATGRPITELGLPHDIEKIDAAFVWGFNKRVFLISGDMYWRFNEEGRKVDYNYPRDMSIWEGVPTPVDAAFTDWKGVTHFFHGMDYYSFDNTYMRVSKDYPKSVGEVWLGCPPVEKSDKYSTSNSMTASVTLIIVSIIFNTVSRQCIYI